jgi:hypothetical protein
MNLSQQDMARLGELLDEAMTLTPEQRFVWLDSLPEQDHPLLKPFDKCPGQRSGGSARSHAAHRNNGRS